MKNNFEGVEETENLEPSQEKKSTFRDYSERQDAAKEGVYESERIIRELLNMVPAPEDLAKKYLAKVEGGAMDLALEYSDQMFLYPKLSSILENIEKHEKGISQKDVMTYSLMLPYISDVEEIMKRAISLHGKYDTTLLYKLRELEGVVKKAKAIIDKPLD